MAILRPGDTCTRIAKAGRAAVLVDAAAYYAAFRKAALRAERSILIVGWDVDSRVMLEPEPADGLPATLLPFLNALLERRRTLQVHVLGWDFALLYALERELLPSIKFSVGSHARLHHALDGKHTIGASHHQKLAVVDDRVAFCGGIDFAIRRWDTPEHDAADPRRVDPKGEGYPPTHDLQLMVDGEVAAALGQICRDRWHDATGSTLPAPNAAAHKRARFRSWYLPWWREPPPPPAELWPNDVPSDFRDVPMGIARTWVPPEQKREAVQEILALTLAAIASAQRRIYIENQYFTSAAVASALAERLEQDGAPEVVLVLPQSEHGWMEKSSMGVLRAQALAMLRGADRSGHLRIYNPVVPGLADHSCMNVHSKLVIVDDTLLKLGSANLSNRSMGVDSECDLVIEAEATNLPLRCAIAAVMHRLLAEHLGLSPDQVSRGLAQHGSLGALIDSRRDSPRHLEPLHEEPTEGVNLAFLDGLVVDPERPIDADSFLRELGAR